MYQFKANGGFGMMHQATQRRLVESTKRFITTTRGVKYELDPTLASEVADSPTSNKAMGDNFPKWIYTGLIFAKFSGPSAVKAYTKIMKAIADGTLPNDITLNPHSGAIDLATQKWVKAK